MSSFFLVYLSLPCYAYGIYVNDFSVTKKTSKPIGTKFKKIRGVTDLSDQFRKIIMRYKI